MEGEVNFQQGQPFVDGVDQSDASGERVDSADAAVGDAVGAFAEFVVDVAGSEHGLAAIAELSPVESTLDSTLAVGQFLAYVLLHLKSFRAPGFGKTFPTIQTPEKPKDFESFHEILAMEGHGFACLRSNEAPPQTDEACFGPEQYKRSGRSARSACAASMIGPLKGGSDPDGIGVDRSQS